MNLMGNMASKGAEAGAGHIEGAVGFMFSPYLEFLTRYIWKEKARTLFMNEMCRLYSEGSGELFKSFIWDLLSLFS